MIVTSIVIWILLIYNFRVAIKGDPLATFLFGTERKKLEETEKVFQQEGLNLDNETVSLLKRFSRITVLEIATFLAEMIILASLMYQDRLFWLCLALFMKNCLMVAVSVTYARQKRSGDKFMSSFHDLPRWLHTVDRFSALLSALGLVYIFISINNILSIFAT